MAKSAKPYRRFRARRRNAGDLDALRNLRTGGPADPDPPPRAPEPGRLSRSQRRALRRTPEQVEAPDPRPRRSRGRWLRRAALALLVLFVVWGVAGYLALRGGASEAQGRIAPAATKALTGSGGLLSAPATTLVIGIDARPGENRSRADTIMLVRTDPDAGEIRYLSIPRDTRVTHPTRGPEKINRSFFVAGQAGTIRAVQRHTGLPIHHIMVINFARFPKLIDELGGVTVNNPTELNDCPYDGGRRVSFPQGKISLDGDRALEFARVRKCDDDFARARRQQELVKAMQSKVLSTGSLPLAPWRGAAAARAIGTDMGALDLAKFGWLQSRLDQNPDDRLLLTGTPQTIGGVSFVVGNPDANETEVLQFLGRA